MVRLCVDDDRAPAGDVEAQEVVLVGDLDAERLAVEALCRLAVVYREAAEGLGVVEAEDRVARCLFADVFLRSFCAQKWLALFAVVRSLLLSIVGFAVSFAVNGINLTKHTKSSSHFSFGLDLPIAYCCLQLSAKQTIWLGLFADIR